IDIMTKGFLTVPNTETRLVVKVFIPKHLVSLDSMKAIASMLWLVDPLLSDIHPAHCGPNSLYSLGLQYTNLARDDANDLQAEMLSAVEVEDPWNNRLSPERKLLELLPHPGDLGETKYRYRIYRILGATSVQDLIHLMDIAIYESSLLIDRGEDLLKYVRNESYSFGIELELYMPVLLPHEGRPDPHPDDGRELSRAEQFSNRVTLMKEIISSQGPLTLMLDEYFDQKFWEWANHVASTSMLAKALGPYCYTSGTVEFRYLEGKGDDHGFWINRIEIMSNLPLDAQQLARRPADNNEILPPLDNGYIDALRDELCTREMKLPCTIQKAATLNESESSTDPDDFAKLLSEKAGFFL
ncbi:hypothetical protein FOC1_g10013939, partial [Fusarium oxysporum f. sp. cubense race 1]